MSAHRIRVVDVGATPLVSGKPPYQALVDEGVAELVGFEPDAQGFAALQARGRPHETFYPYALGDGRRHALHLCRSPGMTSILTPNLRVLSAFPRFADWGEVLSVVEVDTVRLDDVGLSGCDLLKLDVQGYELEILRHGTGVLAGTLVAQIEVEFLPMYEGQPLFSEVESFLRGQGLWFHRFHKLKSRVWRPYPVQSPYEGKSQHLWADAVFVRGLLDPGELTGAQREVSATILERVYGSSDLALRLRSYPSM